jgi:predicted amidohydrolase
MKLAVCQMPDVQGDVARTTDLMHAFTADATRQGAGLVCFPEAFLQGYDLDPSHVARTAMEVHSSAFNHVLTQLTALDPVIVFGWLERDGDRCYNAAVAIEHGQILARYRKAHLLPAEQSVFAAGHECPVFDVHGIRVAILICHDLTDATTVRQAAVAGTEVLLCPCSNLLPRPQAEAWKHRHLDIRRQRARDHGLWIASAEITGEVGDRVAYGPTALIDPYGHVVAQVPLMQVGTVMAPVSRHQRVSAMESTP